MNNQADIRTVEVTSVDAESNQMEMIAKLAAQTLTRHYANHLWMVGWAPGATLVIKLGGADSRYGYTIDAARATTVAQLERAVTWGGGELLERLHMARGPWNGEDFGAHYDGAVEPNKVRH